MLKKTNTEKNGVEFCELFNKSLLYHFVGDRRLYFYGICNS